CHPRVLCHARHCGARPHLNDDLDEVTLPSEVVATPPLVLHPVVVATVAIPADVEALLLTPLREGPVKGSGSTCDSREAVERDAAADQREWCVSQYGWVTGELRDRSACSHGASHRSPRSFALDGHKFPIIAW